MKKILLVVTFFFTGCLVFALLYYNSCNMKNINEFLQYEVEHGKTPSIQYAFFDLDSIIYQKKCGVSNVKSNTMVDSLTTYNLFSITKTFTALAVLQLAQDGKIRLNSPVSDYLPDFPYTKKITVEQLLNHSSGIPNPLPLRWIHTTSEHKDFNRDLFFKGVFSKNLTLDSEPGTTFKYSNLGYVLLGQLIEKVSGISYEDYITKKIIEPCGIEPGSLGFEIAPAVHATGYQKWWSFSNAIFGLLIDKKKFMGSKEGSWKPFNHFYINGTPYGGLVGTGSALIKYAQALLRKDSLLINDYYKNMLFTESIINNEPTGMSYSWYTGSLKGHKYFAHAGGGGGYYLELRVYPVLGKGSLIIFNRSGMRDDRILDKADVFFLHPLADI